MKIWISVLLAMAAVLSSSLAAMARQSPNLAHPTSPHVCYRSNRPSHYSLSNGMHVIISKPRIGKRTCRGANSDHNTFDEEKSSVDKLFDSPDSDSKTFTLARIPVAPKAVLYGAATLVTALLAFELAKAVMVFTVPLLLLLGSLGNKKMGVVDTDIVHITSYPRLQSEDGEEMMNEEEYYAYISSSMTKDMNSREQRLKTLRAAIVTFGSQLDSMKKVASDASERIANNQAGIISGMKEIDDTLGIVSTKPRA